MDQDLHQNQNNQKPQTIGGVTFSAGLSHPVTPQVSPGSNQPSFAKPASEQSNATTPQPTIPSPADLLAIILLLFLLLSPPQRLLQLLKTQLMLINQITTLHRPLLLNRFLLPRPTIIFTPMTVPILLVKMASRRLPVMAILTLTRA